MKILDLNALSTTTNQDRIPIGGNISTWCKANQTWRINFTVICDFKGTKLSNVATNKRREHSEYEYSCNKCEYKSKVEEYLQINKGIQN